MELRVYFHHTKSILQQTVTKGETHTKSILHEVYFLYKRMATKSILFFRKEKLIPTKILKVIKSYLQYLSH